MPRFTHDNKYLDEWGDSFKAIDRAATVTGGTSRRFEAGVATLKAVIDAFRNGSRLWYTRTDRQSGWHAFTVRLAHKGGTIAAPSGYDARRRRVARARPRAAAAIARSVSAPRFSCRCR
jgi:hypothetical protein